MKKLLAILKKDTLLMLRDWPGLAILFIMPAVLLVIITFTQESVIPSKRSGMKIALADADSAEFGRMLLSDLGNSGYFNFTAYGTPEEAQAAVLCGDCQMAVIVPDSATEKLYTLLNVKSGDSSLTTTADREKLYGVIFLYDPAIQKLFRDAVQMPVNSLIQLTAVKVLMIKYTEEVNERVNESSSDFAKKAAEGDFFGGIPDFPYKQEVIRKFREELKKKADDETEIELPFSPSFTSALVEVREVPARINNQEIRPGVLQNNIPAFTLFAMFFIVIPLAGSIINEKNHGTFNRIRTLPVSFLQVVAAKIVVFLAVCILQFLFLLFIGKYIMPLMGEQTSLDLKVNIPALLAALTGSSLAAIGFGILVGAFSNTHGQAATFGSVMVVILALLGGIFVPVHMLPETLKTISYISPLRWGTDAFLGVFARYQGIGGILSETSLLTCFFIISILLAVRVFKKQ
jgi:ABC-2 type transport system permease protein